MSVTLPESLSRPWPRRKDFRKERNYLVAEISEGLRTPLRWACRRRSGVGPTPPSEWRNGLILGPSHIGDVLYNTAALPLLRAALPNCRWSYLVSGPSAQVLEGNPDLHEAISVDDPENFRSWMVRCRARLADYSFDASIAYAVGMSWKDLTLAALLGIPNRVGYVHKGFSGLVTHPVSIRISQPFPAYFRDMVCQIVGQPSEAIPSLRPLVYPQLRHEQAVDRLSARWGLNWAKQPVLACAVTSRQPSGIWPPDQFLKAIRYVREQEPCAVIYTGAKSDLAQLERLAEQTGPGAFVAAGELELLSIVALFRRCRMALTSDSGPRHLANAAGIPVFFVRNLSFRHEEAGAYSPYDHDMAPRDLQLLSPAEQAGAFARIDPLEVGRRMVELWREMGAGQAG